MTEIKTFPVPSGLEQIKDNIFISDKTPSQPYEEQIINQAFKFHSQGNLKEAAKYYRHFINKGYKDHRVFSNFGIILIAIKNFQEAELVTRKAIELKPNFAEAHANLGNILRALGNLQEAELSTRKAIELKPNIAANYSNLGHILKDNGKLQEAELSTRKAIELKPDFAEAHANLGNILKNLGNLQEAELFTRKAIELNPNYAMAHSNLGSLLKDLGNLQEAESYYRKAIKLNPDYANNYSNLGSLLRDIGNLQEAEVSNRKAIELKPNFADAYANLGNIMLDLGNLQEAENYYLRALELNPLDQTIKSKLINLLTIFKPKNINSNLLYVINEEFKKLNLSHNENFLISDNEAIKIYNDGLNLYKKYNLNLEVNVSQIYKKNEVDFNCKRHKLIFNQHKVIPEFCFGCYKVQVDVDSVIELIKLFLVFNKLKLNNNNTRKSMIELRPEISGFYKGLIYCLDLTEAFEISKKLNIQIQKNIKINLISKVKRGCSEYPLEFPQYKEIRTSGNQPMNYDAKWKRIEEEIDRGKKEWGKSIKSLEGFTLNDFLIMRNWIAYAQKIGDQSVSKITNEQIKGPKSFNDLNKDLNSKLNAKYHSNLSP